MPLATFDDLESLDSVRSKLNLAIEAINAIEEASVEVAWGDITGTLSTQGDLQTALNLKANTSSLSVVATTGLFSSLLSLPTTLSGYGITNAYTETEVDSLLTDLSSFATNRANHTGTQLAATISDFNATASSAAPVQSVAGKTGIVSLVKADVGLANVDNTADTAKPISTATQTALDLKQGLSLDQSTIAYAASVDLDITSLTGKVRTILLTGNLTITTSNRANGKQFALRLICDATIRNITFPSGWVFVGNTKPTQIQASKVGLLNLLFFGNNDSDCIATYGESV